MTSALLVLVQAAATWTMVGLIWFVQVVHYPLFGAVGADGFRAYSAAHSRLTTWVVGPPMLVEAATAAWLLVARPAWVPPSAAWGGLGLVGVIWLSTAMLQVPRHTELGGGWNADAHAALVATNWLRTLAWSARGALLLWLLARAVRA